MSFDTRVDATPEVVQEDTPQTLTVSQIIMDLGNGIDRAGIRKKYGLTAAELKMIFSHPKLHKLRVKKHQVIRVQLIDDTVDVNQTSIPVEQEKVDELRDEANTQLIEALNPEFLQPTDNNFYNSHNDNQTEIQD
jgi:hypothetical protein